MQLPKCRKMRKSSSFVTFMSASVRWITSVRLWRGESACLKGKISGKWQKGEIMRRLREKRDTKKMRARGVINEDKARRWRNLKYKQRGGKTVSN